MPPCKLFDALHIHWEGGRKRREGEGLWWQKQCPLIMTMPGFSKGINILHFCRLFKATWWHTYQYYLQYEIVAGIPNTFHCIIENMNIWRIAIFKWMISINVGKNVLWTSIFNSDSCSHRHSKTVNREERDTWSYSTGISQKHTKQLSHNAVCYQYDNIVIKMKYCRKGTCKNQFFTPKKIRTLPGPCTTQYK